MGSSTQILAEVRLYGLPHLLQLRDPRSKGLLRHGGWWLKLLDHLLSRGKGAGKQQASGLYQALQVFAPQLVHFLRRAEQDLLVCLL